MNQGYAQSMLRYYTNKIDCKTKFGPAKMYFNQEWIEPNSKINKLYSYNQFAHILLFSPSTALYYIFFSLSYLVVGT